MHLPIGSYQLLTNSVPVQISMSVRGTMTAMGMLTAVILLAVMSAVAGADMREMVSTAQVILPCQSALACIDTHTDRSLHASALNIKFHMC